MEVAMPVTGNAIDCYEDMFKEITRKLYGEEGLPEAPLPQERPGYDLEPPLLKPEEHITAFGLAALMQNGFPLNPPFQHQKTDDKWVVSEDLLQWTPSKVAGYNATQKLFKCVECDYIGYMPRVAEHWLGTHSNLRAFKCPQCPYESSWAKCIKMHLSRQHNVQVEEHSETLVKNNNPILQEVLRYLQRLKGKLDGGFQKSSTEEFQTSRVVAGEQSQAATSTKRYSCTYCPYATDRRDLFTRHENIHREEKPFQCYVCQKQFNRADHVKKHFLRMHREHPYDLNRIRRHPPKNASGMSYYQKYNTVSSPEPTGSLLTNQLSIPNTFNSISRNARMSELKTPVNGKQLTSSTMMKTGKKKGDKRFTCCYCSWSGVDNWCLKRHMNTHLKPFVCGLCDYKAARSERLATHVLKVHNKRACGKCTFLADDVAQLTTHHQEHHPLEQRHRPSSTAVRGSNFPTNLPSTSTAFSSTKQQHLEQQDLSSESLLQHGNRMLTESKPPWKSSHQPKQHGAARLFSYMEASDGSETECDATHGVEDSSRASTTHNRIQLDFPEAGDVGEEEPGEETELPLFVCRTCGCEFEDDASLETHQLMHRHNAASPAKEEGEAKENVDPNYVCSICDAGFRRQDEIVEHMGNHTSLGCSGEEGVLQKRPRKQMRPKKRLVLPFFDGEEVEVLRHLSGKLRKWGKSVRGASNVKLFDKYMAQLVTRKRLACNLCRSSTLSRYHTKGSLALHYYWRHSGKKPFQCEHCPLKFKHRYQVVLHASREHVRKEPEKEEEANQNSVPDVATTATNLHRLSYFDHSFVTSGSTLNNHMPIIIPSFPPN